MIYVGAVVFLWKLGPRTGMLQSQPASKINSSVSSDPRENNKMTNKRQKRNSKQKILVGDFAHKNHA